VGFEPDTITFNILLHGCQINRDLGVAIEIWKQMDEKKVPKDAITYNTYLSVFAGISQSLIHINNKEPVNSKNRVQACFELLKLMDDEKVAVSNITLNTVLKACCNAMYSKLAEGFLEEYKKRNIPLDVCTYMNLMRLWRRKRDIGKAREVLTKLQESKLPVPRQAYSLYLYTCKLKRDYDAGLEAIRIMREAGHEPTDREKTPWERPTKIEPPSWNRYTGSPKKGATRGRPLKPKLKPPPPRHVQERAAYRP